MDSIFRKIKKPLLETIKSGKSILLLGARQTGKTTLVESLPSDRLITFADPRIRLRYEKTPGLIIDELSLLVDTQSKLPLIIVDEVQKVPEMMDAFQVMIDKKIAQFILTGSSARKLKRDGNVNLLPGRVIAFHMDPLMIDEIPKAQLNLQHLLIYGSLPEMITTINLEQKEQLLESYVITYLEEEVRAEALVRRLASFTQFLELAAAESGYPANIQKLSQQIGVAASTIDSYYQILEDCLIVERIEPFTFSKTRHRLAKAKKYLFFDLGVRRMAAMEGVKPPLKYLGHLFEQFVGLELIRLSRLQPMRIQIRYWQDQNGPEVDWVVDGHDWLIPIAVKWSDKPSLHDCKHLQLFLTEYPEATSGYVVCNTPQAFKISEQIIAIPWQELNQWIFCRK